MEFMKFYPCELGLPKLYAYTLTNALHPTEMNWSDSYNFLAMYKSTHFAFEIDTCLLTVLINSILFIDLYLVMKNPFYPKEKRTQKYYMICILSAFGTFLFANWIWEALQSDLKYVVQILFLMVVSSLFIITLVAVVMTVLRLMKPGTSPELKMAFLKRHGTYFLFYFIIVLGISE